MGCQNFFLIIVFILITSINVRAESPSKTDVVCLNSINNNKYFSGSNLQDSNGRLTTKNWGNLIHRNVQVKDNDILGYNKGISLRSAQIILDFDGREVKTVCGGKVLLWKWEDPESNRTIEAIFIKDDEWCSIKNKKDRHDCIDSYQYYSKYYLTFMRGYGF